MQKSMYKRLQKAVYKLIHKDGIPLEMGCEIIIKPNGLSSINGKLSTNNANQREESKIVSSVFDIDHGWIHLIDENYIIKDKGESHERERFRVDPLIDGGVTIYMSLKVIGKELELQDLLKAIGEKHFKVVENKKRLSYVSDFLSGMGIVIDLQEKIINQEYEILAKLYNSLTTN